MDDDDRLKVDEDFGVVFGWKGLCRSCEFE
jgi:hypothetical protein